MQPIRIFLLLPIILLALACQRYEEHTLEVEATAYNSLIQQTHRDHPTIAAWGDTLKPGMKCIAVSRDLLGMGLGNGTKVEIEGLPGEYIVRDKMNRRWKKKIDIYMGTDVAKAIKWGRRRVVIKWRTPIP